MTTHTELLDIILNAENSGVEFKPDVVQNHDLATELVAFSNLSGGMVLLGVEDDGSISGITRGATLADFDLRRLRDYFGRVRQQTVPSDEDEAAWQTLLINTES